MTIFCFKVEIWKLKHNHKFSYCYVWKLFFLMLTIELTVLSTTYFQGLCYVKSRGPLAPCSNLCYNILTPVLASAISTFK